MSGRYDASRYSRSRYTRRDEASEAEDAREAASQYSRDAYGSGTQGGASQYSREAYGGSSRGAHSAGAHPAGSRGAASGAELDENTVEAYSRENAASRYGGRRRHASRGARGVSDVAREGGAAVRRFGAGKVVGRIVGAVLIVFLAAAVVWYCMLSAALHASEDVSSAVSAAGFGEPYYVLLMGSDSREEEEDAARADSIMLCRVDESEKQVTLVSLPRDLLVDIEGHGQGKLNSSLAYNGFSGAIEAVSDVAGVDISYYATIYFSGFEQLVDDLGGVTVEVPEGTCYKGVWVEAGDAVEINGEEALVLARCRHGNPPDQGAYAAGDYQRTQNQRNLMKAIVSKIMDKPVWEMPSLLLSVAECVETNIPAWKLAELALSMRGMDAEGMYTASAPAYNEYIDGVSYEILDDDEWAEMMIRVKAGEDPNGE